MSSLSHLYNDFGRGGRSSDGSTAAEQDEERQADERLATYEDGYKAGWEDAVTAMNAEGARLTEDFVQRLQDMSFTYQEAFGKLTEAMKPLLTGFVARLLPQVMERALIAQLQDQIDQLLEEQGAQAIELAVSPATAPLLEAALEDRAATPFIISPDPVLSDAQVYLRVGTAEREIDLDAALAAINDALDAFLHTSRTETPDV